MFKVYVLLLPWEESSTLPARILFPFLSDQNGVVWEVVGDDELSVGVNLALHHQASSKPKDVTVKALPEEKFKTYMLCIAHKYKCKKQKFSPVLVHKLEKVRLGCSWLKPLRTG